MKVQIRDRHVPWLSDACHMVSPFDSNHCTVFLFSSVATCVPVRASDFQGRCSVTCGLSMVDGSVLGSG